MTAQIGIVKENKRGFLITMTWKMVDHLSRRGNTESVIGLGVRGEEWGWKNIMSIVWNMVLLR